ncbi:hypothetical protein [Moorena sp. SIO3I6]|uniref:hypothetical protein n=1 Tax=Moorena sp. SIO3I6 TaxID=2607831 RepID=UPI0013FA6281|nr:hypothetical protein [Moorena sp. SIO3I6]NEP23056.1 hypothetical protein [Moorena sp. SIO3I6]
MIRIRNITGQSQCDGTVNRQSLGNTLVKCGMFGATVSDTDMALIYNDFFAYNLPLKATRKQVKETLGFSEKTLKRWQVFIIDVNRIDSEYPYREIHLNFYSKQGCRRNSILRGLTLYQVFVFFLIHYLRKATQLSYEQTAYYLDKILEIFNVEEFEKWKLKTL